MSRDWAKFVGDLKSGTAATTPTKRDWGNFVKETRAEIKKQNVLNNFNSQLKNLSSIENDYFNSRQKYYDNWNDENGSRDFTQKFQNYYNTIGAFVKDLQDNEVDYKSLLGDKKYNDVLTNFSAIGEGSLTELKNLKSRGNLYQKYKTADEYNKAKQQFTFDKKYGGFKYFEDFEKSPLTQEYRINTLPKEEQDYLRQKRFFLEYTELYTQLPLMKERFKLLKNSSSEKDELGLRIRKAEKRLNDLNSLGGEYAGLVNQILSSGGELAFDQRWAGTKKAFEDYKKEAEEKARFDKMLGKGEYYTPLPSEMTPEEKNKVFSGKKVQRKREDEYALEIDEKFDPKNAGESNYLYYATPEEKELHAFLKKTEGEGVANRYLEELKIAKLDKRLNQAIFDAAYQYGSRSPFTASVSSVKDNLLSGLEFATDTLGSMNNPYAPINNKTFHPLYRNNPRSTYASKAQGKREGVKSQIDSDTWDFLYDVGMSGADSLVAAGFSAVVPWAGEALLGGSAAASTYNEALDRGLSGGDAVLTAVTSGLTEVALEHLSIGKILDVSDITKAFSKAGLKQAVKKVASDVLVNFSEETLTELSNIVTDQLINGELSNYAFSVREYMSQGMTEDEARKKAAADIGEQIGLAGLSGALMGFFFGASGSLKGMRNSSIANSRNGSIIKQKGNILELKELAANSGIADIQKAAEDLTDLSKPSKIGYVYNSLVDNAVDNAVKQMTPILLESGATKSGSNSAKGWARQIATSVLNPNADNRLLFVNKVTKDVYTDFVENGKYGGDKLVALRDMADLGNQSNKFGPGYVTQQGNIINEQGVEVPMTDYGMPAIGPVTEGSINSLPPRNVGSYDQNGEMLPTTSGDLKGIASAPRSGNIRTIAQAYGQRVAERLENERPTPQRPTNKKITKAGEMLVKAIGKSMGIEVEFTDNAVDGVADGKTVDHKKVYISRYTVDPIKEVIKHEFTHTTEISKHYEKIQKYLFDESKAFNAWLESKGYAKWSQMETYIIDLYKQNGETLDHEGAKTEIVAKFVSENLFEDGGTEVTETFLKELYLKDRNLFDRFVDWVKSVYARLKANDAIKADIIKLEQKFIRLAETAKKQRVKDNQTNDKSGKSQYLFVGKKSKTANKLKLATAKQMLKDGADSETIRQETGWFKGYDGKWRFEISDKDLDIRVKNIIEDIFAFSDFRELKYQFSQGTISFDEYANKSKEALEADWSNRKLKDYLIHKEIFESYPELAEISIQFNTLQGNATGAYDPNLKCIWLEPRVINKSNARDVLIKSLIHEVQHAIQHIEGFTKGASGVYWKAMADIDEPARYKSGRKMPVETAYKNTAGEIEAYDAARRYLLDDNERKNMRPDIDRENVVFADKELEYAIGNAQYSIPSDHNYVYTDGKASFTEERLNNLFDEHSLGDGKRAEHSNAYVGYISPEDFVSLTSNENIRSRVKDEAYILNEEELKNEKETPFLEYDPATGEVVNHEGRHRMVALKADGIESVAVVLKPSNDSFERRTPQDISLTGQNFAGGKASGNVIVQNAIPLSEKYRTEAVAQFSQNPDADVRYSLPDVDKYHRRGYNQFRTEAMIWANSAGTTVGDTKIFNRNGRDFVLLESTEDGYIEIANGNYKELKKLEQQYREPNDSVHVYSKIVRNAKNGNIADDSVAEDGGEYEQGSRSARSKRFQNNTTGNDELLQSSNKGTSSTEADSIGESVSSLPEKGGKYSIPDIAVGKSNTELEQLIKEGKITLDDAVNSMNDQYGTMPKGENPKVDVDVPNKVSDTKGVRRFARTALESGHLTEGMSEDAKKEILNGALNYQVSSNKSAIAYAETKVANNINDAIQEWEGLVKSGRMPKAKEIALGEVLLVEAAKAGNSNDVSMYLAELAAMGTQLGQSVQALSLLKRLSGAGQLHYISRVVAQLNEDLTRRFGNKYQNLLKLDPNLERVLAQSKNTAEIDEVVDDILTDIAKQMPSTWKDKLSAWRYLAMLGNPRTHIRNFFGNGVFMPAIRLKTTLAAVGEKTFIRNKENRTKVFKVKKSYKEFALSDAMEIEDILKSGGKMSPSDIVNDRRKIFTSKLFAWAEGARQANFKALEWEDWIFLRHHYKNALGGVLQARGVDVKNITEAQLQSARKYAILEAQKATYRDASHFANCLNKLAHPTKHENGWDVLTAAGGVMVEAAMPFKKTPINVLKRGIEYSPLGIATSLANAAMSAARGEFSGTQLINDLSAGFSGTALLALGMFLQSIGWITGGLGYDDEDALERMAGAQPYALTIGDVSFTIDWMAPSSLPLLIGAEIQKANEKGENLNFFDALTTVGEPLTELSFLQGVNDIIEGAAYSGKDGLGWFGEIATNLASSYLSQYVPTVGGQVARTIDDTRRANFIDKNSDMPRSIQKGIEKIKGKIPFVAEDKVPYIDAWGRVEKNDNALLRAFENLASPGYLSKLEDDKVNDELARIFSKTGDRGVIPKRAQNDVTDGSGKTVYLDAEKYVRYAKDKGQYSRKYVEEVMSNSMFREMSAESKAEVIKFLFSYANAKAKSNVVDFDYANKDNFKTAAKLEAAGFSVSSVALAKVAMMKKIADTDGNDSASKSEKRKSLKNVGFRQSEVSKIMRTIY